MKMYIGLYFSMFGKKRLKSILNHFLNAKTFLLLWEGGE